MRAANKQAAFQRARASRASEKAQAEAWLPVSLSAAGPMANDPVLGESYSARWEVERRLRAWAAVNGHQHGIKVHLCLEKIICACNSGISSCKMRVEFRRYTTGGQSWKCIDFTGHLPECFGSPINPSNGKTEPCKPAYLAKQLGRCVRHLLVADPSTSTLSIRVHLESLKLFLRPPAPIYARHAKDAALASIAEHRAVNMAALGPVLSLLNDIGCLASSSTMNAAEMRDVRLSAANHIFVQLKRVGKIAEEVVFDPSFVDFDDIIEGQIYYEGFVVVPSYILTHLALFRKMVAVDAAHCEGKSLVSFGTTSNVVAYDANRNLLNVAFGHNVRAEGTKTWAPVSRELSHVPAFDIPNRTAAVDMEKSISSIVNSDSGTQHVGLFYDEKHVLKNMLAKITGAEKTTAGALYQRALNAPSVAVVESIKAEYGPQQRAYLSGHPDSSLYISCSKLEDSLHAASGAESMNQADILKFVCSVMPQDMVFNWLDGAAAHRGGPRETAIGCRALRQQH